MARRPPSIFDAIEGTAEWSTLLLQELGRWVDSDRWSGAAGQPAERAGHQRQSDHSAGHYVCRGAAELVRAVGAAGGITASTGCIRLLRSNIARRLSLHLGVEAFADDVIIHDARGYSLREWITVLDGTTKTCGAARDAVADPDVPTDKPLLSGRGIANPCLAEELNERQQWVLAELRRGTLVERGMLQGRFGVAEKTARRDSAELCQRGLTAFVREGHGGTIGSGHESVDRAANARLCITR